MSRYSLYGETVVDDNVIQQALPYINNFIS